MKKTKVCCSLNFTHLQILIKWTYDQSSEYKKKFKSLDRTQHLVEEQSHQ